MVKWLLISICFAGLFYFLYMHGFLILNSKRAVAFVGKKRGKEASFTSCTGQIKRILRFREDTEISFTFSCELSKGTVAAEIYDQKKTLLLHLDSETPSGQIAVKKDQRYLLVFRFDHASGEYFLDWH